MVSQRIFKETGISLLFVSAAISVLCLPLYFVAEKWQEAERYTQKKIGAKAAKIKAVFSGDERFMILSVYYRQNHYHPLYALRGSFGLLIQIPFFIAAYSYLSHLEALQGTSFLFIHDLGAPDALLSIGGGGGRINVLPVLMTVLNCVSGILYTRGFPRRDKIQLYGVAVVFLVLLYNSPSGLVLYWTCNNLFSLVKNILQKTGRYKLVVYLLLCFLVLMIDVHFIFLGFSPKRMFVTAFFSTVFFLPLLNKIIVQIKNKAKDRVNIKNSIIWNTQTYIFSAVVLFLLAGLVIPSSLVASSVQEFSFVESYIKPFPFIFNTALQSAGLFLFWFLCVFFLFPKHIQYRLTFSVSLLVVIALSDTFLFVGNHGFLTTTFKFSIPDNFESQYKISVISTLSLIGIIALFSFLLLSQKKIIFQTFQITVLLALGSFTIINLIKIQRDFLDYSRIKQADFQSGVQSEDINPVYTFSETGKNVLIIMLDRGISGYLPFIFQEKPELLGAFDGFTFYPNSVAFGSHTRIGASPLFGGYEYTPSLIQKNRLFALRKHNEALLMLPKLFSDMNYRTLVTDPPFANYSLKPDLSIFLPYPEINAENVIGRYSGAWLKRNADIQILPLADLIRNRLIRFSFYKIAPPVFRTFLYDRGDWLAPDFREGDTEISIDTIDNYAALDMLPDMTAITADATNTYTVMDNDLTHYPTFFQFPDYIPQSSVTNRGDGPFSMEDHYHVNMAALLLLGKWFDFLKKNNVYDNTRIIIASDHGVSLEHNFPGNITLPNGDALQTYNALLLVKDFNMHGDLVTDNTFMSHADVPLLAVDGLIDNPKNPFTQTPLQNQKKNGLLITSVPGTKFTIARDEWLQVHDNIFDPENWAAASLEKNE
jgi:YidC/Oxa1 family membrane protein insertase